ncbi:hypothetical protein G3T14_19560 [Methylobacterium sp. BTF04]|uniref:hypothetical protein n=1 Tax=Methylobacterium sp. BTF04 TaxID=2708300 RepID=UPI0013D1EC78|nr:hypothetical protein [Methylobacterium sp. BTF04]NEU14307.1 hypothetical protein [Methylobacterium sp. BTF04]
MLDAKQEVQMDWLEFDEWEKDNLMRFGAAVLREWPSLDEKVKKNIIARAAELPRPPRNALSEMKSFIAKHDGEDR